MTEIGKITRVSIFIDYDNFQISYCKKHNMNEEDIDVWDILSDVLIEHYSKTFIKNSFEVVEHIGSFLCVGVSDFLYDEEKKIKYRFRVLDRKTGFIIKYGGRQPGKKNRQTGKFELGKEKGVDAEIICQMLMGAFLNHYDACILMSDDGDYVPAVARVQDYFGKKVIQAGFHDSRLREVSYANIPLENADVNMKFHA